MTLLAVDLGASSGRVLAVRIAHHTLVLDEVHRFPNDPIQTEDGVYWDIRCRFSEVAKIYSER